MRARLKPIFVTSVAVVTALLGYLALREPPDDARALAPFECEGVVPESDVTATLSRQGRAIFDCHERLGDDYAGVFELRLHVGSDGTVLATHVGATPPPSQELNQCVLEVAHGLRFPPPRDGACAVVVAPFVLGSPDPAGSDDVATCTGTIPQPRVLETVGRHGPAIFECYEQLRAVQPEAAGTIDLRLRVTAAGVDRAQVLGPLSDPQFLSCVRSSLAEWRFPPPDGGECAIVSVPFALRPGTMR